MKNRDILFNLPNLSPDELMYLEQVVAQFSEEDTRKFVMLYSGKRKRAQDILLFTLLGFFGIAGVQRIMLDQIAMGIIYFITLGFCWIGTIIDLINHKSLTEEFNQKMARDCARMVIMKVY